MDNLKSLLEKNRDGVRVDDIRLLYEDEMGYPLDHLSLGYKKLRSFLLSCSEVLELGEKKGVQYVYLHENRGEDWFGCDLSISYIRLVPLMEGYTHALEQYFIGLINRFSKVC